MKESDYFRLLNKINFLRHELEIALAKQNEITELLNSAHARIPELSKEAPLTAMPDADGGKTKVNKEPDNPAVQTAIEKAGDVG